MIGKFFHVSSDSTIQMIRRVRNRRHLALELLRARRKEQGTTQRFLATDGGGVHALGLLVTEQSIASRNRPFVQFHLVLQCGLRRYPCLQSSSTDAVVSCPVHGREPEALMLIKQEARAR